MMSPASMKIRVLPMYSIVSHTVSMLSSFSTMGHTKNESVVAQLTVQSTPLTPQLCSPTKNDKYAAARVRVNWRSESCSFVVIREKRLIHATVISPKARPSATPPSAILSRSLMISTVVKTSPEYFAETMLKMTMAVPGGGGRVL
jgi:hypothetical protein